MQDTIQHANPGSKRETVHISTLATQSIRLNLKALVQSSARFRLDSRLHCRALCEIKNGLAHCAHSFIGHITIGHMSSFSRCGAQACARVHPGDASWYSEYRYCAAVYALRITRLRTQPSPARCPAEYSAPRACVCALRVGPAGDIGGDKLMDSLEQVRISLGKSLF